MSKKIVVQNATAVHSQKTEKDICKFLRCKDGKINRIKDMFAIIAGMSGMLIPQI